MVDATTGERRLQERFGTQDRAERFHAAQMLDHLNERMQAFVSAQGMMFLATSDARGNCDNTLRAGPAGFIVVLDEHRIAWPEYRGNGVMASRGNILENPHVGLLFVDVVDDVIGLHVNGRATLADDLESERDRDGAPGRRPEHWVIAHVDEAYIHCGKHIPRLHRDPASPGFRPSAKKSDYFAVQKPATTPSQPVPTLRPATPDDALAEPPRPTRRGGLTRLTWRRSKTPTGTVSQR
jgi:predicted pyridoxine 5'-phosphate oxidase superfamily flavin-nucleotide-binding protein